MAKNSRGNGRSNGHAEREFEEDAPSGGHNAKARKDAEREAMEANYEIDKKIEALMKKHIDPLRADKRELKSDLHENYGIAPKLYNARYNTYRLERAAVENKDDITLDTLRELWEATPIGGGVDLVEVAERAAKKRAEAQATEASL